MNGYEYFTHQTEWERYLKDFIENNEDGLKRAIVLIYKRQTLDERQEKETKHENNIGFSKVDALCLGQIAEKIINNKELSNGEIAMSKNKMKKYWKQLMEISKLEINKRKELQLIEKMRQDKLNEINKASEALQMSEASGATEHQGHSEALYELQSNRSNVDEFRKVFEEIKKCSSDGIPCSSKLCNECPIHLGYQLRMNLFEV